MLAGVGFFALGVWLSVHQTLASFGSVSADGTFTTSPEYTGPSTATLVTESALSVVGVALVAVGVVLVAGAVAETVVEHARSDDLDDFDDDDDDGDDGHPVEGWSGEVVGDSA